MARINSPTKVALLVGTILILSGCGAGKNTGSSSSSSSLSSSVSSPASSSLSSDISSSLASSESSSSSSEIASSLGSSESSSSSVEADTTPAEFSFTPQSNVEPNTLFISNEVSITDINQSIPISITGGEYSINGGDFTAVAGNVSNDQTLTVRVLSASTEATQAIATVTLATTINVAFTVTTNSLPLKTVKLEAEKLVAIGGATVIVDDTASAGKYLGNISQAGNGVEFSITQATENLRFAYSTASDTQLNVSINGQVKDVLTFSGGDSDCGYLELLINEKLAKGDLVSISYASGGSLSLDYIELIPSPFQVVGTLAKPGAMPFNADGLTLDKNGNVYVGTSRGATVNRITPEGAVSLFATLPNGGSANGSDFDSEGNLYIANETNGNIHKITPDGTISDFVIGLDGPAGIYIDENDNLIVGLFGYAAPAAKVIKIAPDKTITTLASDGGLTNVVGVAGDGQGRYFASNFLTGEFFEVTNGVVKQLGTAGTRVNQIKYAGGYLYMPNPLANVVVRSDLNGNIELVAGAKFGANSQDGPRLLATFSRPNSIDMSADGKTLYILDFNTGDVRTISEAKD